MKRWVHSLLVILMVVGSSLSAPGALPQSGNQEVAFLNVNVVAMTSDRVLEGQTVLVRGDRIVQIGPAGKVKVPEHAVRIDGAGKYLMPGWAEMHGHIPPPQQAPKELVDAVLFLYIANGVTTVRGMLGAAGQLDLREKAKRGEIWSPTLYLAGPSFNDNSVNSPQEAIDKVRQQKQEGWDLLKIHPGVKLDEYDAMAKTAKEVGIHWVGHIPADVGLAHALEMGQETVDHLDGYIEYLKADSAPVDEAKLAEIVRKTKAVGAGVVPTMALWETVIGAADLEAMRAYPELKYMPPQQIEAWTNSFRRTVSNPQFKKNTADQIAANRKRLLKALQDGGVRILFGTDAPQMFSVPGFSIHREMAHMLKCGLTPYQILQSATKNVGDYFKAKDNFGTIEVGKRADLILVNGNPLKDISNVAKRTGVMVRGRWLSEAEIQKRLEQIAASYRKTVSQ